MGKGLEVALEHGDVYREVANKIQDADRYFNGINAPKDKKTICPDCGATVHRAEGCLVCANMECGWTRC
jgi:hypothetical protein